MKAATPMLLTLAVIAAATGACGIPDQARPAAIKDASLPPEPTVTSPATVPAAAPLTLFFVRANKLVAVTRPDAGSGLARAMQQLLGGPSDAELGLALTSAIPAGTTLQGTAIDGSVARLDFGDALASISGEEQLLAFAQIVVTASAVEGIDQVQVSVAGQPVDAPRADGTLAQGPVTRSDYASLISS